MREDELRILTEKKNEGYIRPHKLRIKKIDREKKLKMLNWKEVKKEVLENSCWAQLNLIPSMRFFQNFLPTNFNKKMIFGLEKYKI